VVDGKNYTASIDLNNCTLPSGVTQACPAGKYNITATLVTNNTEEYLRDGCRKR